MCKALAQKLSVRLSDRYRFGQVYFLIPLIRQPCLHPRRAALRAEGVLVLVSVLVASRYLQASSSHSSNVSLSVGRGERALAFLQVVLGERKAGQQTL